MSLSYRIMTVAVFLAALICVGRLHAATLIVGPGGYNYIQSAVTAAVTGDTILVAAGNYFENITVGKRLILRAADPATPPQVYADDIGLPAFRITANGVTIQGFRIIGRTTDAGIRLTNVTGCAVLDNHIGTPNIPKSNTGIVLENVDSTTLRGNIVENHLYDGIRLIGDAGSRYNKIFNNACRQNDGLGIHLSVDCDGNDISGNFCEYNDYGLYLFSADANIVYFNQFDNNATANVRSMYSCNLWSSPVWIWYGYGFSLKIGHMGNYYGDHVSSDVNGDGIADTAYPIWGTDSSDSWDPPDSYPLFMPLNSYAGTVYVEGAWNLNYARSILVLQELVIEKGAWDSLTITSGKLTIGGYQTDDLIFMPICNSP